MRKTWGSVVALLALVSAGQLCAAEKPSKFFFKKGDRIVFLGDSITEQYQYSSYIERYLTTRFRKWNLTFLNAGISGDTSTGGARRFKDHVLAEKPTAVTIDFGMNDGGYGALNEKRRDQFIKHTEDMLQAAKEAGVRIALMSPNAVDSRGPRKRFQLYLETQKKFYAPLKELAAKYKVPFVDQYAVTRAAIEKMDKDQATKVQPFPDGVHTSAMGGLLMAHTILVGLQAPALVSNVEIDAASGKASSKACTVAKLKLADNGVSFERSDEALPLPVQKDWEPILPYVKHLKDFNWYGLKVKGLATGKYTLLIDGKDVASFTSDQLAEGVNLGNLTNGPIHAQGTKVFQAINAKNKIVHDRFRKIRMSNLKEPEKKEDLAEKLEIISTRQKEIYTLVEPAAHQFELKPAK